MKTLIWTLSVLALSNAAVYFAIEWIRRRFPPAPQPNITPRPFTTFELALGIIPLIVFLIGLYCSFYVVEWMGNGKLKLSNALAYTGVLLLCAAAAPMLVARMCGKEFYQQYYRLGEIHSGISTRGANVFAVSIGCGFILAALTMYAIAMLHVNV